MTKLVTKLVTKLATRQRLGLLALPALLGGLLVAAPGADAATAPATPALHAASPTEVIADCVKAAYEPKKIVPTCADFNAYAVVKTYDSWTRSQARGSGHLVMNDCKPNCASGHFHRYPATFSLHKVVVVKDGSRLFTVLGVTYVAHGRPHDLTFDLPTSAAVAS